MAITYIWNMLNLHWNKIILFAFLFLFFTSAATAQKRRDDRILGKNNAGYDDKNYHYGMYLGVSSTHFNVEHSPEYVQRLQAGGPIANAKPTPSFTMGFVLSRRLGDYFTVRFLPGVAFYNRIVDFETGGEHEEKEVGSTTVQLPFMLKYMAKRRKNSRMYFVAGAVPTITIGGSKREERVENRLRIVKNNFQIEYGVGLDLFYPFFKFAPELRVAHGVPNILIADDNIYARSFQSLRTTNVTLYLNFE